MIIYIISDIEIPFCKSSSASHLHHPISFLFLASHLVPGRCTFVKIHCFCQLWSEVQLKFYKSNSIKSTRLSQTVYPRQSVLVWRKGSQNLHIKKIGAKSTYPKSRAINLCCSVKPKQAQDICISFCYWKFPQSFFEILTVVAEK